MSWQRVPRREATLDARSTSPYAKSAAPRKVNQGQDMKTETIRARIDGELKQGVEGILEELGLTPSTAINLFYKQIMLHHGLPFAVKLPNPETEQAIRDALRGENLESFASSEELFTSLRVSACASASPSSSAGITSGG